MWRVNSMAKEKSDWQKRKDQRNRKESAKINKYRAELAKKEGRPAPKPVRLGETRILAWRDKDTGVEYREKTGEGWSEKEMKKEMEKIAKLPLSEAALKGHTNVKEIVKSKHRKKKKGGGKIGSSIKTYSSGGYVEGK